MNFSSWVIRTNKIIFRLIEEFMLLANILVANRISTAFPDTALLRHHAAPNKSALLTAVSKLERFGICIETSSAGSIFSSMIQYDGTDEIGIARMTVITNLLVKPMVVRTNNFIKKYVNCKILFYINFNIFFAESVLYLLLVQQRQLLRILALRPQHTVLHSFYVTNSQICRRGGAQTPRRLFRVSRGSRMDARRNIRVTTKNILILIKIRSHIT